jgi:hypothetical protein
MISRDESSITFCSKTEPNTPKKRCHFVDKDKNICIDGDKCPYFHDVTYNRRNKKKENKRLRQRKEREEQEKKELEERERHEYYYQIFNEKNEQNDTHPTDIGLCEVGNIPCKTGNIYDVPFDQYGTEYEYEYDDLSYVGIHPFYLDNNSKSNFHMLDVRNTHILNTFNIPDVRDTQDVRDFAYDDGIDYELMHKAFRGVCIYYNSSNGCYKGYLCPFLHSTQPISLPCLIPDKLSGV